MEERVMMQVGYLLLLRRVAVEGVDLRTVAVLPSIREEAAQVHLFIIPPTLYPTGHYRTPFITSLAFSSVLRRLN